MCPIIARVESITIGSHSRRVALPVVDRMEGASELNQVSTLIWVPKAYHLAKKVCQCCVAMEAIPATCFSFTIFISIVRVCLSENCVAML